MSEYAEADGSADSSSRDGSGPFGRTPPHGSIAEEAAKLVEVAHLWLAGQAGRAGPRRTDSDVWADAVADDPATPPECQGCPICAVRRAMAGVGPEVYEHLADAVSSLGAALRALDSGRPRDRST